MLTDILGKLPNPMPPTRGVMSTVIDITLKTKDPVTTQNRASLVALGVKTEDMPTTNKAAIKRIDEIVVQTVRVLALCHTLAISPTNHREYWLPMFGVFAQMHKNLHVLTAMARTVPALQYTTPSERKEYSRRVTEEEAALCTPQRGTAPRRRLMPYGSRSARSPVYIDLTKD